VQTYCIGRDSTHYFQKSRYFHYVTSGLIIFTSFFAFCVRVSSFKFCKKRKIEGQRFLKLFFFLIYIFICSQWFLFHRCQWVAPNSILNLNCCIPFNQRSLFFVYLLLNIGLKMLYFSQFNKSKLKQCLGR